MAMTVEQVRNLKTGNILMSPSLKLAYFVKTSDHLGWIDVPGYKIRYIEKCGKMVPGKDYDTSLKALRKWTKMEGETLKDCKLERDGIRRSRK